MKEAQRQHFDLNYDEGWKKSGKILVTNSLATLQMECGRNLLVNNWKGVHITLIPYTVMVLYCLDYDEMYHSYDSLVKNI